MKKSFILYTEWEEITTALSDEQAGKIFKAIFKHVKEEKTELDPMLTVVFIPIRQALDRDNQKWDNIVKRNKQNIVKRWSKAKIPDHTKNTSGISGIPNAVDNVNVNDNDIKQTSDKNSPYTEKENQELWNFVEDLPRRNS